MNKDVYDTLTIGSEVLDDFEPLDMSGHFDRSEEKQNQLISRLDSLEAHLEESDKRNRKVQKAILIVTVVSVVLVLLQLVLSLCGCYL